MKSNTVSFAGTFSDLLYHTPVRVSTMKSTWCYFGLSLLDGSYAHTGKTMFTLFYVHVWLNLYLKNIFGTIFFLRGFSNDFTEYL